MAIQTPHSALLKPTNASWTRRSSRFRRTAPSTRVARRTLELRETSLNGRPDDAIDRRELAGQLVQAAIRKDEQANGCRGYHRRQARIGESRAPFQRRHLPEELARAEL